MNIQTKGAIIASLVLLAMIIWSIAYGDDIKLASVDLPWFAHYQDWLATYSYQECLKRLPDEKGKYSCNNFILTINSENGWWNKDRVSGKNKNWTRDYWLCQLNSAYHSDFINSQEFQDPYEQIDYCLWVWEDAKKKGKMPRYWYTVRHKRDKWIRFIDPPLSDNIAEPVDEPKLKPTGRICRQVFTARGWEVFQLDNKFGQFVSWILGLKQGDKWFICNK